MTRALLPAVALLTSTGCLSLDFVILGGDAANWEGREYEVNYDMIPESAVEFVSFESTDGTLLQGMWVRHDPPKPPFIWFHGNHGSFNIESYQPRVEFYYGLETHDVFVFDYRGYGLSEGSPSPAIIEEDGFAAVQYVSETSGYEPEAIDMLGLSLGGSVLVHTNDEIGARSIVTEDMFEAAYTRGNEGTGMDLPSGFFFTDPYDNAAAAASVTSPILVIHGLDDDFVDPVSALAVYDSAPEPKELWQPEGSGHADTTRNIPELYEQRLRDWWSRWD